MNRSGLLTFGSNKRLFLDKVALSPTLKSLWSISDSSNQSQINCNESLPLEIRSKDEIYADVAVSKKGSFPLGIKFKQGLAYAKELGKFYKHGVASVWRNNKEVRILKRQKFKIGGLLDRQGNEIAITIPSFNDLTKTMAQQVYIRAVEDKAFQDKTAGELVRKEAVPPSPLFSMTRREYQLLKRTPSDFLKLPLFAIIASIFVEMTPIICYIFPEVTPLTCVLPNILPRIWRPKDKEALKTALNEETLHQSIENFSMKTAYNVPTNILRPLVLTLCLKSKYVPTSLFPDSVLRDRLQKHYLYLLVDNYYLSGQNSNGNLWDLSQQEVLNACLERNLVNSTKDFAELNKTGSAEAKAKHMDELRLKLALFVANFEYSNVGYLAVDHLLPSFDPETVVTWRK